jgi:uncharacterized membrane protein SirB2
MSANWIELRMFVIDIMVVPAFFLLAKKKKYPQEEIIYLYILFIITRRPHEVHTAA